MTMEEKAIMRTGGPDPVILLVHQEEEQEDCKIVPHEECHQVTVQLPKVQEKQVQQIICEEELEKENKVEHL